MGKETELIKAAKTGDIRTLEKYLCHVNKRSSMIGSIKKHLHPNIQDELGYTLLHHATLNGHREIVSFLIHNGASTTIPDSSGSYPLHLASWKGDIEIVRILLTQGPSRANVDQQSNTEDTALHLSSQYGYSGVVEFLLERHANPMMKNVHGETPLDLAAQFGHIDTVHILISHHPEILRLSRPEVCPLHLASRNGHSVVLLSLINAGIPINTVCKSGSALHEAALCGKENTVKLLLDKGIDLNLKDSEGRTVLELLSDFKGDKYNQIRSLIQSSAEGKQYGKTRYMKPRRCRLIAIPKKDSQPLESKQSDVPQLYYCQGDTIVVERKMTSKRYIGTHMTDKTYGFFPIKDVRLFQDVSGKLEAIDVKDIFESPDDGSLHVIQKSLTPQGHLPLGERKSMLVPKTNQNNEDKPARSLSTSGSYSSENKIKEKKKKRLTEKEKKFILSKDTGDYSQLTPIGAPPPSKDAEVRQVTHTTEEKGEFIGSYYLLEVGDYDHEPSQDKPEAVPITRSSAPLYENISLIPKPEIIEKPRSISHGAAEQNKVIEIVEIEEIPRPKYFHSRDYENVAINLTTEEETSSIDTRAPMPLPPSDDHTPVTSPFTDDVPHYEQKFKIRDDYEDVMVSSFNPNYSKVSFQRQYEELPPQSEPIPIEPVRSKQIEEMVIISQDSHPFAGLVQSNSVVSGLSDVGCEEDLPTSPRNRLKSIWDDKRVSLELNQINSYMRDLTTTISEYTSTLPHSTSIQDHDQQHHQQQQQSSVSLWLNGMGLRGYANTFESNGFDDLSFMGNGLLDIDDLKEMGIYDNDQGTIMIKAAVLPPPPQVGGAADVNDWLSRLCLSHLETHFEGYTLEKVTSLWEVQLSAVIGIELLGYRKRLLYGINELRKNNIKWNSGLPNMSSKELSLGTSPMTDVNFSKDYSKIISKRKSPETLEQVEVYSPSNLQWEESKFHLKATPTNSSPTRSRSLSPNQSRSSPNHSPSNRSPSYSPSQSSSKPTKVSQDHTSPIRGSEYATPSQLTDHNRPHSSQNNAKNFYTWYLGSALVKGTAGKHSAEEACLKLRMQTDGIGKMPKIILSISWKGVKFIDATSKMVVSTHLIRDISHCCPDIEDSRVFAYMTKEKETNRNYCHVFMAQSKEVADDIILTVGQSFEVAYQAVVRARSHQPKPTNFKRSLRKAQSPSSQDRQQ